MRRARPTARRRAVRRAWPVLAGLVALLPLAGCIGGGGDHPASPPPGSRAVTFPSADGTELQGRVVGGGNVGIVLSHMLPADQTSWWPFAERLAREGYLALTYDFRGYCPGGRAGCSQGEKDIAAIWQDVLGAIGEIRSLGATRVVLIGASMGGTASLVAAAQTGVDVDGVITLSAPTSIEGLTADTDVLAQVSAPKLFLAGVGDASAADAAQELYDTSPPPKRVEILTTDDHGTDILSGNQAGPASTLILTYLQQILGTP